MIINDIVYGQVKIDEPILIELIKSKPIKRLKHISQLGFPKEYYLFPWFSRYDHSLGVMLLLKRLRAPLEEQVAGLLHDVSHTAFSHTIDWVIGDRTKQDYQDKNLSKIINISDIPLILKKYNFNVNRISNHHNFPLLEQESPKLCADRVDYALREFKLWSDPGNVDYLLSELTVFNNQIIFKTKKAAQIFGRNFLQLQVEHWGTEDEYGRYHLLSNLFKFALDKKIITLDNFYQTEKEIISKLKKVNDPFINKTLGQMKKKVYASNKAKTTIGKFRYTDPEYLNKGTLNRITQTDPLFKKEIEKQITIHNKGVKVG